MTSQAQNLTSRFRSSWFISSSVWELYVPFQTQDTREFSIQPYPTYISTLKICRVGLCIELFYAIIPTLFLCFLLICYPYVLLHFNVFYSCIVCVCVAVGTRSVVCASVCVSVCVCVCAGMHVCVYARECETHHKWNKRKACQPCSYTNLSSESLVGSRQPHTYS